jgi:hypothetical protein
MAIVRLATPSQNAAANAIVDLIDAGAGAGTIEVYDGVLPTNANTAISTQNLLATLTFADPAFGDATGGVVTAGAITSDSSIDQTGTAAWARIKDSDGNVVADVDVTETGGGGTVELNTTSLVIAGELSIISMTFTMPAGA